ncbi:MAG TPA: nuclear transport factor 2 family protein [Pyrinomonadaceae bacterium]|jgi:ketosteroid isomerase-like protein|nr:nuclear transport factor 2 family protein [Pyrinomonadaceae bacterium]
MKNTSNETLLVARRALSLLAAAHLSGDFEPYLEMLTEDYTFYMPLGEFRGKNVGVEKAAACYRQIAAANPQIEYGEPFRATSAGNTVVFEFEDSGTIAGQPYYNRVAASFDVRGEQICGYREYFGFLDLESLEKMAKG